MLYMVWGKGHSSRGKSTVNIDEVTRSRLLVSSFNLTPLQTSGVQVRDHPTRIQDALDVSTTHHHMRMTQSRVNS